MTPYVRLENEEKNTRNCRSIAAVHYVFVLFFRFHSLHGDSRENRSICSTPFVVYCSCVGSAPVRMCVNSNRGHMDFHVAACILLKFDFFFFRSVACVGHIQYEIGHTEREKMRWKKMTTKQKIHKMTMYLWKINIEALIIVNSWIYAAEWEHIER